MENKLEDTVIVGGVGVSSLNELLEMFNITMLNEYLYTLILIGTLVTLIIKIKKYIKNR